MDLFNSSPNILPFDGEANYHGPILSLEKAGHYFEVLTDTIPWEYDRAVIYEKTVITKRKVAWYGDRPYHYTYSNTTKYALPWTEALLELKNYVQKSSGCTFNSCLLNLYPTGETGMAWHSDAERDLEKNGAIGSLSLGALRRFSFKHKITGQSISIPLEQGSLLVMKGTTQSHWLHRLPPTKKVRTARINLTFRTVVGQNPG